jgi:hypothetical protein
MSSTPGGRATWRRGRWWATTVTPQVFKYRH